MQDVGLTARATAFGAFLGRLATIPAPQIRAPPRPRAAVVARVTFRKGPIRTRKSGRAACGNVSPGSLRARPGRRDLD